ncbi:MAG: aldolase [Limibacillus sp.]|jgi:ribulose-5-phosphate 4-epimerase/fuculose-1-phosphate aldolase
MVGDKGTAASDEQRAARIDLAAAHRLAALNGFHEGVCNHFSLMLPGPEPRTLITPFGVHWSKMRASDLLLIDGEGQVLEGEGELELTAACIHVAVHRAHPRAACVMHSHMPHATALTTLEDPRLLPLGQTSLKFYGDVAYDRDYRGLAEDAEEGARIAACLEDKRVLFMGNHGVMVVGASVHETFDQLYYLERAAQLQVLAYSTGRPLSLVGENMAKATKAQMDAERELYSRKHFEALKRMLAEDAPGFAD